MQGPYNDNDNDNDNNNNNNNNNNNIKNNAWATAMSRVKNHWQITSRLTKKSLFTVTNVLFHFLHNTLRSEHTIPLKQLSINYFAIVTNEELFWLSIVTSP